MAREGFDIFDEDCGSISLCGGATDTFTDLDGLTGDLSHKGAEDQLRAIRDGRVDDVETRPVDGGRR